MSEEARKHLKKAESALKTSFIAFKFSPDYLVASMEYACASNCLAASGDIPGAISALEKAAECRRKEGDLFVAGRNLEQAGSLCNRLPSPLPEKQRELVFSAAHFFLEVGKHEAAVKNLVKCAEIAAELDDFESERGVMKCYSQALELYQMEEKHFFAVDLYKSLIGILFSHKKFELYLSGVSKNFLQTLEDSGSAPSFMHKEVLSEVLVHLLYREDVVAADRTLEENINVPNFLGSQELAAAEDLILAMKNADSELLEKTKAKRQCLKFLHMELVKLLHNFKIKTFEIGGGGGGGGEGEKAFKFQAYEVEDVTGEEEKVEKGEREEEGETEGFSKEKVKEAKKADDELGDMFL